MTSMEQGRKTRVSTAFAVVAAAVGLLLGAGATTLAAQQGPWQDDDDVYEVPREFERLSGQAREGCLILGMGQDAIEDDLEACLRLYWTPDRLAGSSHVRADWLSDTGVPHSCTPYSCSDVVMAMFPLPALDDPWWDEQAERHPERRSLTSR